MAYRAVGNSRGITMYVPANYHEHVPANYFLEVGGLQPEQSVSHDGLQVTLETHGRKSQNIVQIRIRATHLVQFWAKSKHHARM